MQLELERQQNSLQLIPSENYASPQVLAASGSVLANKYAEGYPGRRYYQGNEIIDQAEVLAIERAKKLFGAEHVNVQPLSGVPANLAVYLALLKPGDKIMAMKLDHGGHLSHGSPVSFSGKWYTFIHYGVDKETGLLNYDFIRQLARQERPKLIISGYTAYPRTIDFKAFDDIAQEVGAYSMADISHIAGLIAGKAHPSPFPFTDIVTTTTHKTLRGPRSAMIMCKSQFATAIDKAVFPGLQGGPHEHTIAAKAIAFQEALQPEFHEYAQQIIKNAHVLAKTLMEQGIQLVSKGTDNHLILIDLVKTSTVAQPGMGKTIAVALEEGGLVLNANTIPFEPASPLTPSGLRLGTPAVTTRGMKEPELQKIGVMIAKVIHNHNDVAVKQQVRQMVLELCRRFPIYPQL